MHMLKWRMSNNGCVWVLFLFFSLLYISHPRLIYDHPGQGLSCMTTPMDFAMIFSGLRLSHILGQRKGFIITLHMETVRHRPTILRAS